MVLYIDVDETTQEQRLRNEGSESDLATIRGHQVELESPRLKGIADAVVVNSQDAATFMTDVATAITDLQSSASDAL